MSVGRRARSVRSPNQGADSITKNAASAFVTQITTASMTAVLTVFLVRTLGAKQYGTFALAVGVSAIALPFVDLGISSSTSRFVAERRGRGNEVGALIADALKLKLVVTGVLCAVLAALASVIAGAYGLPELVWPLRAIALATFGQSTCLMLWWVTTSLARTAVSVRLVAAESLLELSASMALVLAGAGVTGAAFGRAVGYALGALISAIVVLRMTGHGPVGFWRRPQRATLRLVTGYAGATFAIDASYTLSASLSLLLLGGFVGPAASGMFQAPAKIITLIGYVGSSVSNGVSPRLARGPGQEPNVRALHGALRLMIGFQCLVLAPAVVWAGPITRLILGPGYPESARVLAALAPYIFFLGLAPLVTTGVTYLGEAGRRVPISVATLALSAAGGLTLIPAFGAVGAAINTDIAFAFYTLAHIWLCRRLLQLRIGALVWSLACGLTAATAMGIVLAAVGTEHLTLGDWVVGGVGGLAAYVSMLMFTGELERVHIARALASVGVVRDRPPRAPTPAPLGGARRRRERRAPLALMPIAFRLGAAARRSAADDRRSLATMPPEWLRPLEPTATGPLDVPAPPSSPAALPPEWIEETAPDTAAPIEIPPPPRSPAARPPGWLDESSASEPAGDARRGDPDRTHDPSHATADLEARARRDGAPRPIPHRHTRRSVDPNTRDRRLSPQAPLPTTPPSDQGAEPAATNEETEAPSAASSDSGHGAPGRTEGVYEIAWRLQHGAGIFELRPLDPTDTGNPPSVAPSPPVSWESRRRPVPTPEAWDAHVALVEGLLLGGWRRAGMGDVWFAQRFTWPHRRLAAEATPIPAPRPRGDARPRATDHPRAETDC